MIDGSDRPGAGPVTWPEVIESIAPVYESDPDFFAELPSRLAASSPPRFAGAELAGFRTEAAALAVLRGPAAVRAHLALVSAALPRVIQEIGARIDEDRLLPAIYTLSYLNVVRCCGGAVPAGAEEAEHRWLPQLADRVHDLREPDRHMLAFAACAAALPSLVPSFADLPVDDEPFVANRTFGFDVPGFAGYLASAIDRGAGYLDVEDAWLDFVHRFPYKLATRSLGWTALLYGARAVYATLGGLPEEDVVSELHRLVTGR